VAENVSKPGPTGTLCEPFLRELGVSGAAISTIGGLQHPETLCASDGIAGQVDEAQLDLGEGPCWDAAASNDWVDAPHFAEDSETRWPAFRDAVRGTLRENPVGGLFAFPLSIGGLRVGTVDLYRRDSGELSRTIKDDAEELGATAARGVLRLSLELLGQTDDDDDPRPRAIIHQATGMVLAQLDVTPDEALLLLRGRAFADGQKLRDIARDVIEGRIDFALEEGNAR
jgi:ANTAR domain-containing protein